MKRNTKFIIAGLSVSLIIAFFLSPLASTLPDGLEKVLEHFGSARQGREAEPPAFTPFAEYVFPGIKSERLSTGFAGAIGTALVFGVAILLGRVLVRKKSSGATARKHN